MQIVFLLIVAVLVAFSFALSKQIKSDKDFLVPKDGLPFIVVAFTMAATQFGSSMLVGGVQQAQQQSVGQGFYPAVYTLLAASLSCFLNTFVSPRYRKFGDSVTPPDFIQIRYGKSKFMRGYHAVVYLCSITCVLISQFIGFASMGTAVGLSTTFSVILCAVVVCLLAMGSGMIGVAVTDMIQYAAIMLLLFVSCYFSLKKLGTVGVSFADVASEAFFPTSGLKSKFFYTLWPMIIGNLFTYEYFMRFMSCRSEREAERASFTAGVVLMLTALPVALLGAVANRCYQDADSVAVFGLIVTNDMPRWLGFLLIAVVLMAVLTSADSLLGSISGIASRDIYGALLCRGREPKHTKLVARVSMVVVAAVAALCALNFRQILQISFFFSPLTSGTMFAPMIVGLFWKGANKKGAIAAMICAATAGVLHLTGVITLFDRVAGPALIGTAAIVAFSLLFRDKDQINAA